MKKMMVAGAVLFLLAGCAESVKDKQKAKSDLTVVDGYSEITARLTLEQVAKEAKGKDLEDLLDAYQILDDYVEDLYSPENIQARKTELSLSLVDGLNYKEIIEKAKELTAEEGAEGR